MLIPLSIIIEEEMTKQNQICEPIKSAVQLLESKGFEIVSSTLRDFHFNEYEIKLESKNAVQSLTLQIEGIEKHDEQTYYCKCHWSKIYKQNQYRAK